MNRFLRPVLVATLVVLAVGVGLAVLRPGDLDGDTETAVGDDPTTTTTSSGDDGEATTSTDDTAADDPTTTETTAGTGTTETTTGPTTSTTASVGTDGGTRVDGTGTDTDDDAGTSGSGSGLGSSGTARPADTADGLADTGAESLVGLGLVLAAAGVVARRRSART